MRAISLTLTVIFALAAAATGADDRRPASGTARMGQPVLESRLPIEAAPGHWLLQRTVEGELRTEDQIAGVAFSGGAIRLQEQADLQNGAGVVRGYGVWEAPGGEEIHLVYGYEVPPAEGPSPRKLRGTFDWVGGTGALERLRGKGTLEGDLARSGEIRLRWAGSYELRDATSR